MLRLRRKNQIAYRRTSLREEYRPPPQHAPADARGTNASRGSFRT